MKSLHVNYFDKKGGAAIACKRLVESINLNGDHAQVLTNEKFLKNNNPNNKFREDLATINHKLKKYIAIKIKNILKSENIYRDSINYFNSNLHKYINNSAMDIFNLHWICDEMISIEEINKIKKPIVWTIVDMWPFIGSEHYSNSDYFLKNGKNKTSFINSWTLNRKIKSFNENMHVVCISNWLKKKALNSLVFEKNPINYIPCTIDTQKWKKVDKEICREILGLQKNKKYILFSSFSGINDQRKGFDLLFEAIKISKLPNKDFSLIIIGNSDGIEKYTNQIQFEHITFNHNFEGDSFPLKFIYSACDIAVIPSRLEAFGQVALEAGACELPSIGFSNTGLEDIIDHNENGFLAEYLSAESLGYYLNKYLNENIGNNFSINIRKKIEQNFSYKIISNKYKILYENVIKQYKPKL